MRSRKRADNEPLVPRLRQPRLRRNWRGAGALVATPARDHASIHVTGMSLCRRWLYGAIQQVNSDIKRHMGRSDICQTPLEKPGRSAYYSDRDTHDHESGCQKACHSSHHIGPPDCLRWPEGSEWRRTVPGRTIFFAIAPVGAASSVLSWPRALSYGKGFFDGFARIFPRRPIEDLPRLTDDLAIGGSVWRCRFCSAARLANWADHDVVAQCALPTRSSIDLSLQATVRPASLMQSPIQDQGDCARMRSELFEKIFPPHPDRIPTTSHLYIGRDGLGIRL